MTATPHAEVHTPLPRPSGRLERFARRQGWVVGVALLLAALVLWRSSQIPAFGAFEVRGIDVGTKHQIYDLVRELADAGAAIVLFTSELREIALVCDRVAVLHNGAIVAEMAPTASETDLLTAAHGLEVTAV